MSNNLDGELSWGDMWFAFLEHYGLRGVVGAESCIDGILEAYLHEQIEDAREVISDNNNPESEYGTLELLDWLDPWLCPHNVLWETCAEHHPRG